MSRTIKMKHESASLTLRVWKDGEAVLSNLWSQQRKKGHASALMQKVVEFADEEGLTLILTARRFGNMEGLDNKQLMDFYEKFGFARFDRDHKTINFMSRQPSQKSQGV